MIAINSQIARWQEDKQTNQQTTIANRQDVPIRNASSPANRYSQYVLVIHLKCNLRKRTATATRVGDVVGVVVCAVHPGHTGAPPTAPALKCEQGHVAVDRVGNGHHERRYPADERKGPIGVGLEFAGIVCDYSEQIERTN